MVGDSPLFRGRQVVFAETPEERSRGMSGIEDAAGLAMLFEASAGDVFWMKGCKVPLDLVFLGRDGKVLDVATLRPPSGDEDPERVVCPEGTEALVEVEGGGAGVKAGDSVL